LLSAVRLWEVLAIGNPDNRDRMMGVRQAAEALFAPKPKRVEPSIGEVAPAGEAVRKPCVLAAIGAIPAEHAEPKEALAKPAGKPLIPTAHVARIRAWLTYGMTTAQVAEMYGVAAGEIERVLRIA
jgi:hypothetical protein